MVVKRGEIEYFIPLLTEHLEAVLAALQAQAAKNRRFVKVDRRELIETYLATGDINATAARCQVSRSAIRHVLYLALRHTRRLAGIRPGGLPSDLAEWAPDAEDPIDDLD